MRFETSVLKQCHYINADGGWETWNFVSATHERPSPDRACTGMIESAGWNIPHLHNGMVLVFSTTPVKGASTCQSDQLAFAGYVAIHRHKLKTHFIVDTKLWWWPEFIPYEETQK